MIFMYNHSKFLLIFIWFCLTTNGCIQTFLYNFLQWRRVPEKGQKNSNYIIKRYVIVCNFFYICFMNSLNECTVRKQHTSNNKRIYEMKNMNNVNEWGLWSRVKHEETIITICFNGKYATTRKIFSISG